MDQVIFEKNIVYGETDNEYLTLDIYRPFDPQEEFLPILVLIHGGAFQSGSKEMYTDWGERFAKDGYFVIAVNYRLATPSSPAYPGALEDIGRAMNWLVRHANVRKLDVERIGLIGDSAGAYLAAAFALQSAPFSYRICSVVGVYGIYDLVDECLNPTNDRKDNFYEQFLGVSFKGNIEKFRGASPVSYINDAAMRPTFQTKFFLTWGEKDKIVKPSQSKEFARRLKEASIKVETAKFEEHGHFWFNQLPGVDGGTVKHEPNHQLYPALNNFLKRTVCDSPSGNFSEKQIQHLSKLENLNLMP